MPFPQTDPLLLLSGTETDTQREKQRERDTGGERGGRERRGKVARHGKDINSEMRHMDGTKSVKK